MLGLKTTNGMSIEDIQIFIVFIKRFGEYTVCSCVNKMYSNCLFQVVEQLDGDIRLITRLS